MSSPDRESLGAPPDYVVPAGDRPGRLTSWRTMPCVWRPWLCQLVFVERSDRSLQLDVLSLEPSRASSGTIPAGALFSIRQKQLDADRLAEIDVVAGWTHPAATVTMLAGRDGRSSWVCLSRGHQRVVLTDALCDLD